MTVELWIRDGNPWYLSPDIWVVPGSNPTGEPGPAVVNTPNFIWARVTNRGDTGVTNATVKYYWGNPGTLITRGNAIWIGTSYVSLAPNESKDVLCMTPWIPMWINNGHECLIVEAFCAENPLPPHSEDSTFGVPANRQIAQLNLTVILANPGHEPILFPFSAGLPARTHVRDWRLIVRQAPLEAVKGLEKQLGKLKGIKEVDERIQFAIRPYSPETPLGEEGREEIALEIEKGRQEGFAFSAVFPDEMLGKGALFLIEEYMGEHLAGGIGVLIAGHKKRGGEK